ncbi:MAG: FAD-dependent oxidoreductase [Thermoleophilaceae bacterium]
MQRCAGPVHVAIVGSGPAGAYAAQQLLKVRDTDVRVDVYDRLPTPWGLVRAGVAPDHPKIKSVTRVFEKTAVSSGFRFAGNVDVGRDVAHYELAGHYHAVVYAIGSAADRRLGIPGEDLPGSYAAADFVAWYNGHPDHHGAHFDLSARRAVVIGNGNVALDIARMLVLGPRELASTDIADDALAALGESSVEEVLVLGRRGPAQAAFTNPELRELADLDQTDVIVDVDDEPLAEDGGDRNLATLAEFARREPAGRPKRIVLRFLASPVEILGSGRVEAVQVAGNELVPGDAGSVVARPTGRTELVEAELVFRSVGYRGVAVPGLPFDEGRATIPHEGGRVTDPVTGAPIPGVYAAGWIKRGPSGVIGTNKRCAQETVDTLLEDLRAGRLPPPAAPSAELLERLRSGGIEIVDRPGWVAIDERETSAGERAGRPRVKIVERARLLEAATAAGAAATSEERGAQT